MRLLDQVASAPPLIGVQRGSGEIVRLPGPGSRASFLRDTPLRYILDESASRQCFEFIEANTGMFDPANELLRALSDSFWLEWFAPQGDGTNPSMVKAGVLVESLNRGRQGSVHSFWEVPGEAPAMAQASLVFDLDHAISWKADRKRLFSISRVDEGPLSPLLDHILIWLDEPWADELGRDGVEALRTAVRSIAAGIWRDLIVALGFATLFASGDRVQPREVDRSRLNAARLKQGKPALLDHCEVTIRTDSRSTAIGSSVNSGGRSGLRLHYVRGHMVRRAGKQFWRTAHLRGDLGAEPLRRTVNVKGAGSSY